MIHFWKPFPLVSTMLPKNPPNVLWRTLLQSCFPAVHSLYAMVPLAVPLQGQDFALPLVKIHEDPVRPFPQPAQVLKMATWPSAASAIPPSLRSSADVLRVTSKSFLRLISRVGSTTGPRDEPGAGLQFSPIQYEGTAGISALSCLHVCRERALNHHPLTDESA